MRHTDQENRRGWSIRRGGQDGDNVVRSQKDRGKLEERIAKERDHDGEGG